MKKSIIMVILLGALVSCGGDSADVQKAKQDLGVIAGGETTSEDVTSISIPTVGDLSSEEDTGSENIVEETNETQEINESRDPRIEINYLSGEKMLELDELNYSEFKAGYSKITGTTLGRVDQVKVTFSNDDSDFPNDPFILKEFTAGDDTFAYNASSRFKVLDFGLNRYEITAYHDGGESVLELLVMVSENDDKTISNSTTDYTPTQIESVEVETKDLDIESLPKGGAFGDVVSLGNDSFTYSDIKGLEVKSAVVGSISCGVDANGEYPLSNYLKESQNSWFYWNTCRDIVAGKGINFFVVRLEGDEYVYEKHYVDTNNGLYGTYELERGTGVDKNNIAEKNTELKAKNGDFTQLSVVDSLFRQIVE